MKKKITVLIVDDHAVIRVALAALLSTENDLEVIGQAKNGEEAVTAAVKLQPDVIVMDLVMPKASGSAATAKIISEMPDSHILIMTSFSAPEGIQQALAAGATGAIMKTDDETTFINAIRHVAAGERFVSQEVRELIKSDPPLPTLTPRQRDVLESMVRGLTNKDIAMQLGIRQDGVDQHVRDLLSKIGAANRTEAVAIALKKQLLKI